MEEIEKSLQENFEIAIEASFEQDSFSLNIQVSFEDVLDNK